MTNLFIFFKLSIMDTIEKKKYKSTDKTCKKIAAAYLNLINSKQKFNVCGLVKEAKVNRGTFYLHFKNLQEVANYIENYLSKNFKPLEVDFRMTDISKTPEIILNKLNEILLKDLEFYKLIIKSDNNALMKRIGHSVSVSISNNFEVMKYVTNYENFKIVVKHIVGGATNVYTDWLKGNINCTLPEVSSFLTKLFREGLKGIIKYAN